MTEQPKEIITAQLYDDTTHKEIETIIADSLAKTLFSAILCIYGLNKTKYTGFYPNFTKFKLQYPHCPFVVNTEKQLECYITHTPDSNTTKTYTLKFIKGVDMAVETYADVNYEIDICDNQIVLWMLSSLTKTSYCEAVFLATPYSMVHTLETSDDSINLDIASMIIDYNRLTLPSVNVLSICKEPDIFSIDTGKELTYKKAMKLKNEYMITVHSRYTDLLDIQIARLKEERIRHDRIKRHLIRSNKKIDKFIKNI